MVNRPFELLGALSKNRLCLGGGGCIWILRCNAVCHRGRMVSAEGMGW